MCYSAMLKEEYAQYIRATGAEMDLEQFVDIFWNVAQGARITIPRAVERWFDNPATAKQEAAHQLIRQRRAAQATTWQQELFVQKKRLADAERKLAVKLTKVAENDKRIATNKIDQFVKKLHALDDPNRRRSDGRIFPMHHAPIVISDAGHKLIRLARYHCRLAGKPAGVDAQFPGLYNARRDNLEKYWRPAFGSSHALLLVESFYENVDRAGRNAVLHFVPRPADTMLIACLYSVWKDPKDGKELLSFAAITDEPPPEVAAAGHDRMIINLKPENVDAWLTPQGRSDADLQAILDDRQTPYYEHQVLAA
jgi:putative SOS response-associated peptidase YedK